MSAPIVIVDSNRDGLEMYVTALALEGITAETATSAGEAMEVIERTKPRAVVTELRLPGAGGADLVKSVRRSRPLTFIVGLSTAGEREVRDARAAGCDLVLRLPCLPATLVERIRDVIF